MKQPDDLIRLQHIVDFADRAISYTAGLTQEEFTNNEVLQYACVHLLEIIGEAANDITDKTRGQYPDIPWLKMINMRNRLIHGYIDVNIDIVWLTIKDDLPTLTDQVRSIRLNE
jgi:uncharacterized protein with HEPN domain